MKKTAMAGVVLTAMFLYSSAYAQDPVAAEAKQDVAPSVAPPAKMQVPQADVIKGQGQYAATQLKILASIYGSDPTGSASREAFTKGWAPVQYGWSSPTHGWPARGANIGESLAMLFAQVRAAKDGCPSFEGACQESALKYGRAMSAKIMSARNPGVELDNQVSLLD